MTTSKIAQMASLFNSPELMNTQKQTQQTDLAFGAFLSQTAGNTRQEFLSSDNVQKSVEPTGKQAAYERETARAGYREESISSNQTVDEPKELPEDAVEKLKAFEKQVKEVVAEKLGVSEEEVTQQMQVMGLTVMDLMEPSKLASLVMELTGSEDIGGLLFNQEFQQIFTQIAELSQELAVQMELTPEEMKQLLVQMEGMEDNTPQDQLSQETEVLPTEKQAEEPMEVVQQTGENADKIQTLAQGVREETEVQTGTLQNTDEVEEKQQELNVQVQETNSGEETENTASEEESFSGLSKEGKGSEKTENRQEHVTYHTTTQTISQGQTVEVTQTVVQTRVNVDDLFRQVSQMTRVLVGQAESSIEMQLNPANLGKVYLQVVSKEGVISAQLAAQNEAVKEALESQLVVLKENMNQQGLKVEAIEVTIASHEFERNLEENQHNAPKEQQEAETRQQGRRNLNLGSLEELEGLMTEEENLTVKMMSEQGNSMDVTA